MISCCQIAVGGGDQLAGEAPRRGLPDALKLAALQDAQQLDLNVGVELADLVEKHGAVGAAGLEPSAAVLRGAGEGAAPMAEQLRLDQRRAQRRQVDGAEARRGIGGKRLRARIERDVARQRDGARHQLLAGPRFADDQRRDVGHAVVERRRDSAAHRR